MTLSAEHTVNISILMSRQSHVVHVGSRNHVLGHGDWLIPKLEIINAVRTFRHGEEALTIGSFHSYDQQILTIPLDGSTVERGIHHNALHQIRIIALT